MIETIDNFISKLDKLNFDEIHEDGFRNESGYRVSYKMKLHGSSQKNMFPSAQAVVNIWRHDIHVKNWGCTTDNQHIFVDWFIKKKSDIQTAEYNKQYKVQELGKSLWDKI